MTINFDVPEFIQQQTQMLKWVAESTMRPYARELDENEHARPTAFVEQMWPILRDQQKATLDKLKQQAENGGSGNGEKKSNRPSTRLLGLMLLVETLAWGDAGIYLCLPSPALRRRGD